MPVRLRSLWMRWWRPCIAAGLSLLPALSAQAQPGAWPLKPVRLVVSSSAGGPYDDVARALGPRLTEIWGQTVVVENTVGAGGTRCEVQILGGLTRRSGESLDTGGDGGLAVGVGQGDALAAVAGHGGGPPAVAFVLALGSALHAHSVAQGCDATLYRRWSGQQSGGPWRGACHVDVRIGIVQSMKELDVELPDDADRSKVLADIETALATEGTILWLTDRKGRQVGVPVGKVAYVELDPPASDRRVGFGIS